MAEQDDVVATRAALRVLAERYAGGVDRRDVARFLSAFHSDARLRVYNPSDADEPANEMLGHEQIGVIPEMIKRYPKTYHVLGQSTYEIDGDVATGEVYCMAHHLTPDPGADPPGGTNYVMFIRYDDEYRAGADGEWRIADRRVLIDWTETRVANPPGR